MDDAVPEPLERIYIKALSKRAAERHASAMQLADELRGYLNAGTARAGAPGGRSRNRPSMPSVPAGVTSHCTPDTFGPDRPPGRVVPMGLRAFDAHDTDFFLEL